MLSHRMKLRWMALVMWVIRLLHRADDPWGEKWPTK